MTDTYKPIACSLHDEYEIAIMRKKQLNIKWSDDTDKQHAGKAIPKDILVKDKEEFLVVNTLDNKELCIRMDKITLLKT